jgi:hypothetical protein
VWGKEEGYTGFWCGNMKGREHLEDPDVDGKIILRRILRKWEGVVGTGWSWLSIGTFGGYVTRVGERRGVYRVLVRKHKGKRPLGRPRC